MKKRICFLVALSLMVTTAQAQSFSEGRFQGIFARDSVVYADVDLLSVFNLNQNSILKEVGASTVLDGRYRLKFTAILPNSKTGTAVLPSQLVINGIAFGPKDSKDTQSKPVTLDTSAQNYKFELDYVGRMPNYFQPKFFGEYLVNSVKVTGVPTGSQGTDTIEAKDTNNKFLFGLGATGYYLRDRTMVKYEAAYTFADKGWYVDLGGRYSARMGFVEGGWRFEQHKVGPFEVKYQGPYASAGLWF